MYSQVKKEAVINVFHGTEGTSGLMNNKNIPSGELKEGTTPSEPIIVPSNELAQLKAQIIHCHTC